MRHGQDYPSLDALRKKDAGQAAPAAAPTHTAAIVGNPLAVRKLKRRQRSRTALRVGVLSIALMLVAGTVFGARLLTTDGLFGQKQDGFFASLAALFGNSQPLQGENDDRVNILVLGRGGQGHDGPNLTDTMELVSIKPSTKEVSMLSIPRDLYVEVPGFGYTKLNSAFALGEDNQVEGGGAAVAVATIEQITGQEIPYYVTLDFKGFEQIVDNFGGVDVEIPRTFYDTLHAIQYEAGPTHFDGKQALYYVRARYTDVDGGDFKRAERAQLVVTSLRSKALTLNPVGDLGTITTLLQSLGDHVRTNLQLPEIRRVYELVHDVAPESILTRVIDDEETKLVYGDSRPMGGINASVLVPNDQTWDEIHRYVASVFEPAPPEAEVSTIEVHNGTDVTGIAATFVAELPELAPNCTVLNATNADREDYDQTFIVDETGGKRPQTVELIRQHLATLGIEVRVITAARYDYPTSADLILVLGSDYADATQDPDAE